MPSSPPICIFALTTLTTLHLWRSLETSGGLLPSLFVLRGGEGARGERREKGIDTVRFREPNTAKIVEYYMIQRVDENCNSSLPVLKDTQLRRRREGGRDSEVLSITYDASKGILLHQDGFIQHLPRAHRNQICGTIFGLAEASRVNVTKINISHQDLQQIVSISSASTNRALLSVLSHPTTQISPKLTKALRNTGNPRGISKNLRGVSETRGDSSLAGIRRSPRDLAPVETWKLAEDRLALDPIEMSQRSEFEESVSDDESSIYENSPKWASLEGKGGVLKGEDIYLEGSDNDFRYWDKVDVRDKSLGWMLARVVKAPPRQETETETVTVKQTFHKPLTVQYLGSGYTCNFTQTENVQRVAYIPPTTAFMSTLYNIKFIQTWVHGRLYALRFNSSDSWHCRRLLGQEFFSYLDSPMTRLDLRMSLMKRFNVINPVRPIDIDENTITLLYEDKYMNNVWVKVYIIPNVERLYFGYSKCGRMRDLEERKLHLLNGIGFIRLVDNLPETNIRSNSTLCAEWPCLLLEPIGPDKVSFRTIYYDYLHLQGRLQRYMDSMVRIHGIERLRERLKIFLSFLFHSLTGIAEILIAADQRGFRLRIEKASIPLNAIYVPVEKSGSRLQTQPGKGVIITDAQSMGEQREAELLFPNNIARLTHHIYSRSRNMFLDLGVSPDILEILRRFPSPESRVTPRQVLSTLQGWEEYFPEQSENFPKQSENFPKQSENSPRILQENSEAKGSIWVPPALQTPGIDVRDRFQQQIQQSLTASQFQNGGTLEESLGDVDMRDDQNGSTEVLKDIYGKEVKGRQPLTLDLAT